MPIKKAGFKHLRQTKKRTLANRRVKLAIKRIIKKTPSLEALSEAYKIIDKAVKKGVIKKNTAARKKSRLAECLIKAGLLQKKSQ